MGAGHPESAPGTRWIQESQSVLSRSSTSRRPKAAHRDRPHQRAEVRRPRGDHNANVLPNRDEGTRPTDREPHWAPIEPPGKKETHGLTTSLAGNVTMLCELKASEPAK